MTRYHGIHEDTYDQILIDSGAVYTDFIDMGNMGTLLGATRGGAVFTRKPKYADLAYEGAPGKVVGSKHLLGYEVTLEVSVIAINEDNMEYSVPNAASDVGGGYMDLSEEPWDADDVHVLDAIALVAERTGGEPINIVLKKPICESDLVLSFKDKSETVTKWVFSAYYTEADMAAGNQSWYIGVPQDVIVMDKFVAVSSSANTGYSSDGTTWASASIGETGDWRCVAYGDGVYAALSHGYAKAAYSLDGGANWTVTVLSFSRDFIGIAYGGGKFVGVAEGSDDVVYSSDGINWTLAENVLPFSDDFQSIAYGAGKFVAICDSTNKGKAVYSSDGISWSQATLPLSYQWKDITFGADLFVAVGVSKQAVYSADGVTWYASGNLTTPYAADYYSVAYGAGKFVAVTWGESGLFSYSSDGITWTASAFPATTYCRDVCFGDGLFIATQGAGSVAVMYYSSDGVNWSAGTMPSSSFWYDMAYG